MTSLPDLMQRVLELQAKSRDMTAELTVLSNEITVLITAQVHGATKKTQRQVTLGPDNPADGRSRRLPTNPQQNYIVDLCKDKFARVDGIVDSQLKASQAINSLRGMASVPDDERDETGALYPVANFPVQTHTPPPEVSTIKVQDFLPVKSLVLIPDGRYAVTSTDNKQTVFIRKSHRRRRHLADDIVIQYKSSDSWIDLQIYQGGTDNVRGRHEIHNSLVADLLTEIMLDKGAAAHRYGERFGECSNCGRELTDDRSRYYALGTECIKSRHDIVAWVEQTKGEYQQGAASVDA